MFLQAPTAARTAASRLRLVRPSTCRLARHVATASTKRSPAATASTIRTRRASERRALPPVRPLGNRQSWCPGTSGQRLLRRTCSVACPSSRAGGASMLRRRCVAQTAPSICWRHSHRSWTRVSFASARLRPASRGSPCSRRSVSTRRSGSIRRARRRGCDGLMRSTSSRWRRSWGRTYGEASGGWPPSRRSRPRSTISTPPSRISRRSGRRRSCCGSRPRFGASGWRRATRAGGRGWSARSGARRRRRSRCSQPRSRAARAS